MYEFGRRNLFSFDSFWSAYLTFLQSISLVPPPKLSQQLLSKEKWLKWYLISRTVKQSLIGVLNSFITAQCVGEFIWAVWIVISCCSHSISLITLLWGPTCWTSQVQKRSSGWLSGPCVYRGWHAFISSSNTARTEVTGMVPVSPEKCFCKGSWCFRTAGRKCNILYEKWQCRRSKLIFSFRLIMFFPKHFIELLKPLFAILK